MHMTNFKRFQAFGKKSKGQRLQCQWGMGCVQRTGLPHLVGNVNQQLWVEDNWAMSGDTANEQTQSGKSVSVHLFCKEANTCLQRNKQKTVYIAHLSFLIADACKHSKCSSLEDG